MRDQNTLVLGSWNALCDRCGFKFKNTDIREEWNNLQVCTSCWEPRHPSDFIRGTSEDTSVAWVRPDDSVVVCGPNNISGFAIAGCAISGNILNDIPDL